MIVGKNIKLKAVSTNDINFIVNCRNNPNIYKHFYEYEPTSEERQKEWLEKFYKEKNGFYWTIEHGLTKIGTVSIYNINWRSKKAEWGRFFIDKDSYPNTKGFGSEVEALVLKYVFEHLNMNRLQCDVLLDNEFVWKMHESFGFKEEGIMRQYIYKNGEYKDVIFLSLLKEEFLLEKTQDKIKSILG
jgi:UDP-4-amino-4,6-dideoxy-N-acetyl-beta-L-altrosamine N-acetyltransferase